MIVSRLLTVLEAAGVCGVSSETVRRWIDAGDLAVFRRGRVLRVPADEVDRFIAGHTSTPKAAPKPRPRPAALVTIPRVKAAARKGAGELDPRARLSQLRAEQMGEG